MAGTGRRVSGVVLIMLGVLFSVVGVFAAPVAADDVNQECNGAFQGNPEGSLAVVGSPAAGTIGENIDSVSVTASWDEADWSGDTLDKILNCVTVNDVLVDAKSSIEKPTANDGGQPFTIDVSDLDVDDEVCARVRLSGTPTAQNPSTQKSNVLCWTVVEGTTETPTPTYTCVAPSVSGDDATLKGSTTDTTVTDATFNLVKDGGTPAIIEGSETDGSAVGAANDLAPGSYTYSVTFIGDAGAVTTVTADACAFTVAAAVIPVVTETPVVTKTETVVAGVQVSREAAPAVLAATAAPAAQGAVLAATGLSPALLAVGLGFVGLGTVLVVGARRTVRPAGNHYIA